MQTIVAVPFALLALTVLPAAAAHQCTAGKVKAASRKVAEKLACHRRAAIRGEATDPACLTRAEERFALGFARAESRPPCFGAGDAAAIESKVDTLVAELVTDLRPAQSANPCAATKLGAARKKVFGKLNCHARAATRGSRVDGGCLAGEEARFSTSFARAESRGGCLTSGDAAMIESSIDAFVADTTTELRPRQPSSCAGRKLGAAGTKARQKFDCGGVSACLADAEADFADNFAKAELKGDCFSTGDAAAIEGKVDAFVSDTTDELQMPVFTKCSLAKMRTAGIKAKGKLGCYAVAADEGLPVDGQCMAEAERNFAREFRDDVGDCLTTGDAAAIEGKVDAFTSDVAQELMPLP